MVTTKIEWDDVDDDVRKAVEIHSGVILKAETAQDGFNSQIAAVVQTTTGKVFVKGLGTDHPRVWTQHVEAAVNPYVREVAPGLLWHAETARWNLLGFEYVHGRRADYSPDSEDLVKISESLRRLQKMPCPDLPLKRAEQRWSAYVDDPSAFAGDYLLHTDYNPENVLVADRTHLVDWAWSTKGTGWIDPGCWVIWLMAAGDHSAESAEAWAARIPSWNTAPQDAVNAFAEANAKLWAEIVQVDPNPWTARMATAAERWSHYRIS
ncbi:aminoglycoside phosphotransferase [Frankia sp. Cppng1_Ct_nod]|uniref:aminoglycoside phosphotransferase n=1 Tax=Frankia sp. Cppng1_Ct_nod TaxID=2897162 RepID=UPI0010418201|nr:aminoglycoside phosphotransferase [Frankia sp. Cppng1_Ct_nod]